MKNLLYIIALLLIVAWAVGYIGYSTGGSMHVLLVIAIIIIVIRLIQGKKIL